MAPPFSCPAIQNQKAAGKLQFSQTYAVVPVSAEDFLFSAAAIPYIIYLPFFFSFLSLRS